MAHDWVGQELKLLPHGRAGASYDRVRVSFETRAAVVGVVGLGYVGLPLAVAFGENGFRCVGVDLDVERCETLSRGGSYLPDVSQESVRRLVAGGRLTASRDCAVLREADAILICVPTPVHRDKRPDLSHVLEAGEAIGRVLRTGHLVVLESTCYPGTTEDALRPRLEGRSGLQAGRDFWLAFSPERIDPGNDGFPVTAIPKVVGGISAQSTELAAILYAHIVPEVVTVSSPREAEMSKLIENIFRHVNIALANELAIIAEHLGIDFWEALAAASSKPFGFMPFYPGPGVGGHCIPVDPHYLAWKAREHEMPLRLTEAAEQINASMPALVVDRVVDAINRRGLSVQGAQVLLLGMSYKRGIGDVRGSPALRIMELLKAKGAEVAFHDPHVPEVRWNGEVIRSLPLTKEVLSFQDCVVLVTDHQYDLDLVLNSAPLLVDTRNAVKEGAPPPNYVRLWGKNGHLPASYESAGGAHYDHSGTAEGEGAAVRRAYAAPSLALRAAGEPDIHAHGPEASEP